LVTRSLFVLYPISQHGPNLEVFASHSLEKYLPRDHPPLGLYSPTEFHRAILCSFAKSCNCSPGVQPPTACSDIRSPLILGLPHPVRCAFRFSQPPSAFLLRTPPGIISAGNAHGVRPPEPFPCNQPGHPLGATCLHAVSPSTTARLQGLGPTAEPPLHPAGLGPGERVALLGFRLSKGFSLPAPGRWVIDSKPKPSKGLPLIGLPRNSSLS
jgi:hypothetical protein